MKKKVLIITGPTAVGKTDFVDKISNSIPSEIVNLDVGQFYKPIEIGTAKPRDWKHKPITHHLFDIIDEPKNYTVQQYRKDVIDKIEEILSKNKLPILVGGSGFYLLSLFFPPIENLQTDSDLEMKDLEDINLWQILNDVDPIRAEKIPATDKYRIQRALEIIKSGIKASDQKPIFNPFCSADIIILTKPREELYQQIEQRTDKMLVEGWIEEVQNLSAEWKNFLMKKKLIGYDNIIEYLNDELTFEELKFIIKKKTRNYAKRQLTFFRMVERKIEEEKNPNFTINVNWLDLTLTDLDLYIKQLCERYKDGEVF